MPATNCSKIESSSEFAISRWAGDIFVPARVSAPLLYSPEPIASKPAPSFSPSPPKNRNCIDSPITGLWVPGAAITCSAELAT